MTDQAGERTHPLDDLPGTLELATAIGNAIRGHRTPPPANVLRDRLADHLGMDTDAYGLADAADELRRVSPVDDPKVIDPEVLDDVLARRARRAP